MRSDRNSTSENDEGGEGGAEVVESVRQELDDPLKYGVVMYNDDYTTMEFVIEILQRYFQKTEEEARAIMLCIHQQGLGIAGVFTFEIAETKVAQVHQESRVRGFPLKCSVELV